MKSNPEQVSYDCVGTASTPATLTAAYTGNTKTFLTKYMPNIHLDFKYTPAVDNAYALVKIEVSNDDGVTFFPLVSISPATGQVDTYVTPVKFPSSATTGAAVYSGYFDTTSVATHVKVSVLETTGGAFGTFYCRASFFGN